MKVFKDFDWVLLGVSVLLAVIGLSLIYSVFEPINQPLSQSYFHKQLLWLGLSVFSLALGLFMPFRWFETLAFVFYFACLILLVAVLLLDGSSSTHRWIVMGRVRIQPSELSKIALLFVWARVLSSSRKDLRWYEDLLPFILFLIPFLLILKEPDLGTSIILFVLFLSTLYWRGISGLRIFFVLSPIVCALLSLYSEEVAQSSWLLGIYVVLILAVAYWRRNHIWESAYLVVANLAVGVAHPMVWKNLEDYQRSRIIGFLNPSSDKLGLGWQVFQSKIAIGSGGLTGKGFLAGTQKALEYIPARHTDFIFSVVGEELGFVGSVGVLLLFSILFVKAISIAAKVKNEFASTVCAGIAVYFFFQVFINIAMTVGIAPVTGIPLPFLSYGGSSLVVSMFFVGFLLNCSSKWYEY